MKSLFLTFAAAAVALTLASVTARAQEIYGVPEGYELVDSLIYTPLSFEDEGLSGRSIYDALPGGVTLRQSAQVRMALDAQLRDNPSKTVNGYRVRIFFDNKQDSRTASEAAMNRFLAKYHGMRAYRSYSNPYFKVTVGDFRTRAEAQAVLLQLKADFPSAFIVRERMRYPALNSESFKVDTVKVLRPIEIR